MRLSNLLPHWKPLSDQFCYRRPWQRRWQWLELVSVDWSLWSAVWMRDSSPSALRGAKILEDCGGSKYVRSCFLHRLCCYYRVKHSYWWALLGDSLSNFDQISFMQLYRSWRNRLASLPGHYYSNTRVAKPGVWRISSYASVLQPIISVILKAICWY